MIVLALVASALACRSSRSVEDSGPPETTAVAAPVAVSASVAVTPLDGVEVIASGLDHVCALRAGGVFCWGQPLDGGTTPSEAARPIRGLAAIHAIDAAGRRTCALGRDGALRCWGERLGDADGTVPGQVFVQSPGGGGPNPLAIRWGALEQLDFGAPVTTVAVGMTHICALTDRRDLYCWGSASGGQLRVAAPMEAPELTAESVDDVQVGHGFSCYTVAGKRRCVGSAPRLAGLAQQQYSQFPGWHLVACGVTQDLHVQCNGSSWIVYPGTRVPDDAGDELVTVGGIDHVDHLAVGLDHACATRSDRTVWCWGQHPPAQVALAGPVRQLVAGSHHACALLESGRVECWGGSREYGRSGDAPPVEIALAGEAIAAASVPVIPLREAIERYRRHDTPTPAQLAETTWRACLDGCGPCHYELRFGASGSFVADGSCPELHATTSWKGAWTRWKDHVVVREQPAPSGVRWEWQLDLRGTELVGERKMSGEGTRNVVQGSLDATRPPAR